METLEVRRLLVVGGVESEVLPQNPANPEDTNNDGFLSPSDALSVINALNRPDPSGAAKSFSTDVDGDGIVTPRDALLVINRLNSHSEKSSVPPQQRAIGLRKALDAGIVPPRMSLSDAQELLETLENGGHYEAGERYRNGQMLNINQQPKDLNDAVAMAESEDPNAAQQSLGSTSESIELVTIAPEPAGENDPLALLESAEETLSDPLHDPTIWRAFADASTAGHPETVDRLANRLADQFAQRLATTAARLQMPRSIADSASSSENTEQDILDEIAALRATLGDAHSQVAQLFANIDVEGIIEQIGVDLGTLAEAVLSHDSLTPPDRVAIFAQFLSRDYLQISGEILP